MYRFLFIILCLQLGYNPSFAQESSNLSVQILVKEKHSKKPVSDLLLSILEAKKQIQTDEKGSAFLTGLLPGSYHIHIHSYEIKDTTLIVHISKNGTYEVLLDHAQHVLDMVEVHQKNERGLIQNFEKLNQEELSKNSGFDIATQLKNVNGVTTMTNGANIVKPIIHGLHSNRILMLNNGIRQEDQQWGSEHAPNIDPFIAQQITVLKGAAGVRYGTDALAGVVLVEPLAIRKELGWAGNLNISAFSNNRMGQIAGYVEHRFAKLPSLAIRLQSSAKTGGNYQIPGGFWVANTGVREANFSSIISYQMPHRGAELFFSSFNTQLGIYSGSHTGSKQDLLNAINSDTPLVSAGFTYQIARPKQEVHHQLLKAKAYWEKPSGVWQLIYAFQTNFRQEYDVMRVDNGLAQLNLQLNTHNLNLNFDHNKFKNIKGQTGFDASYQHNTFRNGDRVFIPSYYAQSVAAYVIERYALQDNWEIEAGLRYDFKHFEMYNPEGVNFANVRYRFDYQNPSATIAVKHNIGQRYLFTATLSQAWRAPQAAELFSAGFHQAGARIEYGNRNLKPEKALGLNLGARFQIENKIKIELSLYGQSIQDFIYLKPGAEQLTIRGYYKTFNYVQTNALLSGLDYAMQYQFDKHWQNEIKFSIVRARDWTQKDWLILMPADRVSANIQYNSNANKKQETIQLGLNANYVLQQTRIPENFDQIDYPRPPAAYFLVDANCNADLYLAKKKIKVGLSVYNLFNTKYRDYLDLFRYFVNQPGTNVAFRLSVPFNH